jgi:DNA-binding XRE family transcriptional regulator
MTKEQRADFYIRLGLVIRELRENSNLRQEDFADALDMSRASIVNIEKGRQCPSLHLLVEMSEVLDVKLSSIIFSIDGYNKSIDERLSSDWEKVITLSTNGSTDSQKLSNFIKQVT